jgi:hypothetical protein
VKTGINGTVVKVGHGRGFVVEHSYELPAFQGKRFFRTIRLVVTAAHCLPRLPKTEGLRFLGETYKNLLGPLSDAKRHVWAQCAFADPVADVAILQGPDDQRQGEQHDAYEELTESAGAFTVGAPSATTGQCRVLKINGHWEELGYVANRGLCLKVAGDQIEAGMSGSPIVSITGKAIGLISIGSNNDGECPQPLLMDSLPGWLLRTTTKRRRLQ